MPANLKNPSTVHYALPFVTAVLCLLTACGSSRADSAANRAEASMPGSVTRVSTSTLAEPAFTPLMTSLDGWTLLNADAGSFILENGTLKVSGDRGWLRSPREYTDFVLRVDFRFLEPSSDSGIFLRVEPGTDFILGWPGDAYQVQVRDISENPGNNPLPLAHIYRHVVPDGNTIYNRDMLDAAYTGVGEWQQYEIRVLDRQMTVSLNGTVITTALDLDNLAGYIGFQSERGTIEYRNLSIYEF